MESVDIAKIRREKIRWLALETLNSARPVGASEELMLAVVNDLSLQVTRHDLRRELDYLEDRKLVRVTGQDRPSWHAELTRDGVDVAEYTVDCDAGIGRPRKYW